MSGCAFGAGEKLPRPCCMIYTDCVLSSYLKKIRLCLDHRYGPKPRSSVGQTSAALGTAAGQNLAAIAGGHTLAEAVLLGTLALLGLIGTKHGGHLLIKFQAGFPGPTTALHGAAVCFFTPGTGPGALAKMGTKGPFHKALSIIDETMAECQPHFFFLCHLFFHFFHDNNILWQDLRGHTIYPIHLYKKEREILAVRGKF